MTRKGVKHGWWEGNPEERIWIGRKPTWTRMAPYGTAEVIAETWLAERMKSSRHVWIRRFWWVPQTFAIEQHAHGTVSWIRFLHAYPNGPDLNGPVSNLSAP